MGTFLNLMDFSLLESFISIYSVFPNELKLSQFIDHWITTNVSHVVKEKQPVSKNRINTIYSKGKGKKSVLLVGHLDTVPVVDGWITNPLKPVLKNGKLYGLGAWDMKAGLYMILQCLKKFEPHNITLKVAFTVDEENYSEGAYHLVKSDFVKNTKLILVPEPGFDYGHNGLTIGRTGRSTYTIYIKGKSVHGSKSQEGINAINEAYIFIKEALKLKFNEHQSFGKTSLFPASITSSQKGFSIPDECTVEIDCNLVTPDSSQSVLEKLRSLSKKLYRSKILLYEPNVAYKKRPTPFCEPFMLDKNNNYVKLCQKVVKYITGKAIVYYRQSVADECIFAHALKVPVITIGPEGKNAHQANESVNIESVETVEKIYMNILNTIDKKINML